MGIYSNNVYGWRGIIQTVISAVDAKSLMDRYLKERWSNKKLVEEVKKVAREERNTTRILWGITGVLDVLYAGTVALTGALIPAALFLFIALTITALGMTIGGLMSKRGFIRIMEGYTEKKLMDKCRKV